MSSEPVSVNVFAPTKPHAKQLEVIEDPRRFKILRAGRKFRKTSLLISWLAENAMMKGLTCPYIAPNRLQAKNIVWKDHILRLLDEFKKKKVPYKMNETELTVTFPNNGRIQLLGVENQETLRGISNWGAVACDEYDDWVDDIWPLIIRPNLIVHKAPAIIAGTPKGMRGMYRLSQQSEFKEFHYTSHDNPDLDPDELAALEKEYRDMGEDYYLQEIMAEYVKPVGLVYKEWDVKHFMDVPYNPALPLHISFDWGVNDATAVIWLQPGPNGELRIIDYYESNDVAIEHYISVILAKPYKSADLFTGDPAGKQRNLVTGTSVIDLLASKGIYVRVKDGVKLEDQIRITHTFMPRLFVDKKLGRFHDILTNYRYPERRAGILDQTNEKPIHDSYSHGARALEYYCVNVHDLNNEGGEGMIIPKRKAIFGRTGW